MLRSYKPSKLSILGRALNFEEMKILHITFFVAIEQCNKKCLTQNSSKLKN